LLWLRSLLWLVAFTFLVVLSFGPLGQMLKGLAPEHDPALRFAAQCAGAAIALAIYVLLVRLVERRPATELAPRPALAELAAGLLIGLLMFAAVMAILVGGGLYQFAFAGPNPAWNAAGLAIESGVVEELIVRGIILRLLWRGFGPIVAFTASAILFGAGHLPNPNSSVFAAICIALEAGVMLGAFYALTGRLWVSIGVHAGWNFTQGYLFGAAVSGGKVGAALATSTALPGHPLWLTGGAFGPEASLPALLVCSSVGFATLWAAWRAGRFDASAGPATASADSAISDT
jgi:membrane protease YdiL (CAAX protease family)